MVAGAASSTSRSASVWGLDPSTYQRHSLHADHVAWVEKNCYVDLLIEVLHAAGLEPAAMLPFTLASDFDGEQWTFYKPPHVDLLTLYGVQLQELSIFKPLLEHVLFQASQGRVVLTEADAFWLPDTQATDYRKQHTKTTIGVESVDVEAQRLGYFHNAGYYVLEGEDFRQLFRLGFEPEPTYLPLFAEVASFRPAHSKSVQDLAESSKLLLKRWLAHRPVANPFPGFAAHVAEQVPLLRTRGMPAYHAFAFATIRQCGSGFELTSEYLRWLERASPAGWGDAAVCFEAISSACKALILKGARAMMSSKPSDFSQIFAEMGENWDAGMARLASRL